MSFPNEQIETLWAPWRAEYFSIDKSRDFLLDAAQTTDDAAHFVVSRRRNTFLILNKYPYASGHMMAVPYRKIGDVSDLTDEEKIELFDLSAHAQKLLRKVANAQGFNIGFNIGKCAGAGVVDHLHLHIVPRWEGDVNFMPVLSGAHVLPEALAALYEKLMKAQAFFEE